MPSERQIKMTATTVNSAKAWAPDVQAFLPSDVIPEALIFQAATVVTQELEGDAPVARIPWIDDAAAEFVAEGAEIDEAEPELAETIVATGKISQLIPVSREQFGQNGTANLLSESVRRAIVKRANEAFIAQVAPAEGKLTPPEGILTQAAWQTEAGSGVGTITDNLDPLALTLALVESNGATPSQLIMSPNAWAMLRTLKTGEGSAQSLLGAGTEDADKRLLGLPVITTPAVTEDQILIVDRTAIPAAVGNIIIAQSEHAYFSSDRIALRATWRIGWKVAHPNRLAVLDVNIPGA